VHILNAYAHAHIHTVLTAIIPRELGLTSCPLVFLIHLFLDGAEWDVKLYYTIPYHTIPYHTIPYLDCAFHGIGSNSSSPTRFHSERLVCRHLPPSSEEPRVPFQLLYQLDLLSSVTLTFSSAFRLVRSVSVDHWLCKVPLQRIWLSVTLIGTFIIIIIICSTHSHQNFLGCLDPLSCSINIYFHTAFPRVQFHAAFMHFITLLACFIACFWFGCQYQSKWLTGKTRLRNDL